MRTSLAVAIALSLVCLFVFFHTCHGIICYSCFSKNYKNKDCENLTRHVRDNYIVNYRNVADNCMKMVLHKVDDKNVTVDRKLRRGGFADIGLSSIMDDIKRHKVSGYQVDFFRCREDRCNGN